MTCLHYGHTPSALASRLLGVIHESIIPLTTAGVSRGCKVFGAAILSKSTLSVVVAATNDELTSPLLHGEVTTLLEFHKLNSSLPVEQRIDPRDCVFVSTHEPCSLCLSAITWSGFDNFYYLFTYEDTRATFAIPHDINILKQVFQTHKHDPDDAPLYNATNDFWSSSSIQQLITQADETQRPQLQQQMQDVKAEYNALSDTYQQSKSTQAPSQIPLN
ncbi:hypothetical protein PaG_06393 [Moesziomyces aphidis]|uniref:CMP/dCMP-type deaminase domain-containing protein n=1 Tax=Moesziomyces aphidis TaxID=84754 RepID=W3VD73_MOEAP|nr:hypothetical protein PaG_06393 [Moesziomyces aphidis]